MSSPSSGGLTVTLIGADGAGKSTVARALRARSSRKVTYVYMGANPEAATHMLFTTRLWLLGKRVVGGRKHVSGPPDLDSLRKRPARAASRLRGHLKSLINLGVNGPEEVYRQCVSWWAETRGRLVVQDRHPLLDYYASDVLGLRGWRRVGDRIHGFLIRRVYRGPGRVLLLDAPAEVLFARKPEGTLRSLEARREEYLALREVIPDLHVIDVDRPIDAVLAHVGRLTGDQATAEEREYVLPSPSASRADERVAQLASGRNAEVQGVLDLLATLEETGHSVWLDRGWGVDAILGFTTREHRDVDLVTTPGSLGAMAAALTAAGYVEPQDFPRDSSPMTSADRIERISPTGLRVEIRATSEALEDGFGATGSLGGAAVPCVDAARQLGWRVGRKLNRNDVQAIELLHESTGTPVPHELRPLGKARVSYRARRLARTIVTLGTPNAPTPRWINRLRQR
ncbi:hypothetical protein Poly30_07010 [Planctomycetes bacterium Poly30]|uniref:Thymidylate kinase n=1 Tax=Saltatorellus ferox TaxID=2528018 RepID=A0A518EM94_9BACT|nr:hypothetical protein Poly30_07010 [Planctomycetes bacterium Poly30]